MEHQQQEQPATNATPPRSLVILFRYSIDVVVATSNAIEYHNINNSNTAEPVLFLSIWKVQQVTSRATTTVTTTCDGKSDEYTYDDDDHDEDSVLLARYAITSAVTSCDGLSRIVADQQYKLGTVRAIFLSSLSSQATARTNIELSSLPSMLYKNQQETLSIVVPISIQQSRSQKDDGVNQNTKLSNSKDKSDATSSQCCIIDRMEEMIQLIHGSYIYPKILLCSVPLLQQQQQQQRSFQWYQVYKDEHIIVHITTTPTSESATAGSDGTSLSYNGIMFLYTFLHLVGQQFQRGGTVVGGDSLLFLPTRQIYDSVVQLPQPWLLPVIEVSVAKSSIIPQQQQQRTHQTSILRVIVLSQEQPVHEDYGQQITTMQSNERNHAESEKPITFFVSSLNNEKTTMLVDPGLLVRAQQQTVNWRKNCSHPSLLQHFPYIVSDSNIQLHERNYVRVQNIPNDSSLSNYNKKIMLQTGTSIMFEHVVRTAFHPLTVCNTENITEWSDTIIRVIDRNIQRERRQHIELTKTATTSTDENNVSLLSNRTFWPNKLIDFLSWRNQHSQKVISGQDDIQLFADENEIDLDDDDDYNNSNATTVKNQSIELHQKDTMTEQPYLLVLGTGCASPSPYRNASGYVLLVPSQRNVDKRYPNKTRSPESPRLMIAIEVGEGFCTQFHRYAIGRRVSEIQLIWISHAHWDHYGGLVNLLHQIYHQNSKHEDHIDGLPRENKRQRTTTCPVYQAGSQPPWVVAPKKVLQYLKLVFDQTDLYFVEVLQDDNCAMEKVVNDLNSRDNKIVLDWVNLRVDHSCLSYGFVLTMQLVDRFEPFIFSFSGDTRPCRILVDQCRQAAKRYKKESRVDFLLHEATFDDTNFSMSFTKKHSTVSDAVMVGRDVDSHRLLLTHFSQRYDSFPSIDSESNRYGKRMLIGFALDGMKVYL